MFRVCSEYVQSMFRVCSEYIQSMFRVRSEYVQGMFRVRSGYAQSMFSVCSEYVKSIFEYVQVKSLAYLVYILGITWVGQFWAFFLIGMVYIGWYQVNPRG